MKLSKRIWITRKSRIHASERMERYDLCAQVVIIYYTVFIIGIGIWDVANPDIDWALLTVIMSVVVLCASVFLSTRSFKVRSLELKKCYIKLHQLLFQAECLEQNENECNDELHNLEKEYIELLSKYENHSRYDYLLVKYECRRDDSMKLVFEEWVHIIINKLRLYFLSILIVGFAPLVVYGAIKLV